jgi:crossover junction endodeoxyribonuclease RusA
VRGSVFVPGVPAPQGSKRHVGRGILVESSRTVGPWRERVALTVAAERPGSPSRAPVSLLLRFTFARPKSHLRRDGSVRDAAPAFPSRPDVDKLARASVTAKDTSSGARL